MQSKEYWQSILEMSLELRHLRERAEHYADRISSISSPNLSGTPPGGHNEHSRVEDAASAHLDALTAYDVKVAEYREELEGARRIIQQVKPARYRRLLELRYLEAASWREITRALGYKNKNSVFTAHHWALVHAGKHLTFSG